VGLERPLSCWVWVCWPLEVENLRLVVQNFYVNSSGRVSITTSSRYLAFLSADSVEGTIIETLH
jgi:hypothetical protein